MTAKSDIGINKMKRIHYFIKTFLASTLFLRSTSLFAQTSLNAASNHATIGNHQYDYSIGEMTLVSTQKSSSLIVTQGYWQPTGKVKGGATSNADASEWASNISVYPNPTENLLNIETTATEAGALDIRMMDATGKILLRNKQLQIQGKNKSSLDLSSYAAGVYYLILRSAEGKEITFKIQKTK